MRWRRARADAAVAANSAAFVAPSAQALPSSFLTTGGGASPLLVVVLVAVEDEDGLAAEEDCGDEEVLSERMRSARPVQLRA